VPYWVLAAAAVNPHAAKSPHHIIFPSNAFSYEIYPANDHSHFRNRAPTCLV